MKTEVQNPVKSSEVIMWYSSCSHRHFANYKISVRYLNTCISTQSPEIIRAKSGTQPGWDALKEFR